MTASNETDPGSLKGEYDHLSPWASNFMDALHGEHMEWKIPGWKLVHTGVKVEADANSDGNVSLLEAWNYAWNNTSQRIDGTDTYWLDDDGNGLPNYWNETDNWTGWPSSIPCDNGTLADSIWLPIKHCNLTVETRLASGTEISGVSVWVDDENVGNSSISINITVGYHEVKVEPLLITYQGSNYYFSNWTNTGYIDTQLDNPTNIHPHENKTIIAYYSKTRYMQNAKWDSTYWKMLWNNTLTHNTQSKTKSGYSLSGYLGVRIYNGTDELTSGVVQVGRWFNLESEIKSTTWELEDDVNVTGTYIKIEIYCKFQGESWQDMGVTFKTETFGQNTILNATTWTICLYGSYYIEGTGPLGILAPLVGTKSGLSFMWGCSARESRIEDMVLFSPP